MASSARLDELRKKFDENPRRYFAPLANEYRKAGETDQAIAICREYLPQQPGHMSGHIVFGQALYEARQFEEAKTVFETALSLDPENLIALRHLGDISLILGNSEDARGWYRRVLDADPRNEEIQAQLASLDKAASTAPTPAVSPAQAPAVPATPAAAVSKPTPSSAPTVVVSAIKPPIPSKPAAPGPVTATSPTAEVRLDEVMPPPAPSAPAGHAPEATLEIPTTSVTQSALGAHPVGQGEAHAPVEGLESHAASAEAPPLDSFSLEGLETTSLAHAAPAPEASALPELDLGHAAAAPAARAATAASPAPSVELLPASAPAIDVGGPAEELQPLDLDLGGVSASPAAPEPAQEVPHAAAADLVFISPEPEPAPAPSAPASVPELLFEEPAAAPPVPAAELRIEEPATPSTPAEAGPFVTETMADLYLEQGHREEALRVFRALLDQRPGDAALEAKVRRIESEMAAPAFLAPSSGPRFADILRMVAARRPGFRPEAVHENGGAPASVAEAEAEPNEPVAYAPVPEVEAATPPPTAPPTQAREDALAGVLGFAVADAEDEQAANALAIAFSINGTAAALSGAPARPAANELSLDAVFGAEQQASGPAAPPPSSFSFDQFFANREAATAGNAGGSVAESAEEVAQFTQWLEGLKRR